MAKQRYINTHFWDDTYVVDLDATAKLLFLYLLTNPLTNIAGAYEISIRRISFDMGIDSKAILEILARFEQANKIIYRDGWILILNFIKNQSLNPKMVKGIEDAVSSCPIWIKDRLSIAYQSLSYLNRDRDRDRDSNENLNSLSEKSEQPPPTAASDFPKRQWSELTSEEKQMTKANFITHLQTVHPSKNVRVIGEKLKKFCAAHGKSFALERLKGWVENEGESLDENDFLAAFGEPEKLSGEEQTKQFLAKKYGGKNNGV